VRAAAPDLCLAAAHAAVLAGLLTGAWWAAPVAAYAEWWPVGELLTLLVLPFILWIFAREERTPLYQRVLTLPVVIVALGGVTLLVRFLRVFWIYLLARSLPLLRRGPSPGERDAGLVRSLVGVPVFLVLATIFLNRPSEPVLGLMAGATFDARTRYLGKLMLFAVVYFVLVGAAMAAWAWLEAKPDVQPERSAR
jgi:hypothetical protein